jgi:hypothetical protein
MPGLSNAPRLAPNLRDDHPIDKDGLVTLAVAEIVGEDIYLVADSQLTAAKPGTTRAAAIPALTLKPVVLHPGLCVAYAGRAEDALAAVRALRIKPEAPLALDAIEESLLKSHASSGQEADFPIACLEPTVTLTKISGGRITRHERAFLGPPNAYDEFHQACVANQDPDLSPKQQLGEQLRVAMERVIDSPVVPSVGGFCVRVASDDAMFRYRASIAISGRVEIGPDAIPGVVYPLPTAGTGEGGYRYAMSGPVKAGIGALGIYLQPGDLGMLLYPKVSLNPIQLTGATHDEFLQWVQEEFGFSLEKHCDLTPMESGHPFVFRVEGRTAA